MEKQFFKQLTKMIDKLEEKIGQRTETFENRTERWQDSEAGEAFAEKTSDMEILLDELHTTRDSVELLID